MTLLYPYFLLLSIPLLLLLKLRRKNVFHLVHIVILMLLLLALSRPAQKESLQEGMVEGKELLIALDVSYSMRAKDISPTRYAFAKQTIRELLKLNPTDNIMLIAFTTNPLLLSPPTTDHALINIALESLNPEYILTKGTSLKHLFSKLKQMEITQKQMILISDGGEEEDLTSIELSLQQQGISLHVLALGSKEGTTITKPDNTLLKDKHGNLVVSRINPALETLTTLMQGSYMEASKAPTQTAIELNHAMQKQVIEKQEIRRQQVRYKERYEIPLLLAAFLFMLLHTKGVKYILIVLLFLGLEAEAAFLDGYYIQHAYSQYENATYKETIKTLKKIEHPSLQSQMLLADSYYQQGYYKKAISVYASIRTTLVSVKQQLFYNTANAYVMLKSYDKAKIYYTKTLQLGEDEQSSFNLALITLITDKSHADLGIAHPKSQNSASSKSESQEPDKKQNEEDAPSSGSGGGGEKTSNSNDKKKKKKLQTDPNKTPQPLGSKAYELINKGYIRETHPW